MNGFFAQKIIVNIKFEFLITLGSDYFFVLAIVAAPPIWKQLYLFVLGRYFLNLLKTFSVICFNTILDLY